MSVKYVTIFVDDFTSRSLDYPNVHFYDFGRQESITAFDDWYYDYLLDFYNPFDFGDIDRTVVNYDITDYYHSSQFTTAHVSDSGRIGPTLDDYYAPYQIYLLEGYSDYITTYQLGTVDSSSESVAQHGDWVLEAFYSQLDDPNSVEVIAIDIDFTQFNDYNYLFSNNSNAGMSNFEVLYNNAVNSFYDANNTYLLTGLSASFTTSPNDYQVADAVDDLINEQYALVIQSAPNVSSSGIAWGNYIDNVINVGAWNVDNNGYALAANINDIDVVDIYGDGYIQKNGWGNGWNFGTSFATPRVTAEIINFSNEHFTPLILDNPNAIDPNQVVTEEEITTYTDWFVKIFLLRWTFYLKSSMIMSGLKCNVR